MYVVLLILVLSTCLNSGCVISKVAIVLVAMTTCLVGGVSWRQLSGKDLYCPAVDWTTSAPGV